jgi:hypothetical protein
MLAFVAAVAVGFGAAWFLFGKKEPPPPAPVVDTSEFESEIAKLKRQLQAERNRAPLVRNVVKTQTLAVTNKLSPHELLDRLTKLHPDTSEESRNRVLRHIVHHLQLLAESGEEALPVIHEFLRKNVDVDYLVDPVTASGERERQIAVSGSFASRNPAHTDFLVQPSLRLGLIDVLDQIGGEAAVSIMAEVLADTGRGVEVGYLARLLQEVAPDRFRDVAINAAKELLSNPPPIEGPTRIDDNARAYLYHVLLMYDDASFAPTAAGMLVTANGRTDRQALNYLNTALKDQAVPHLQNAYKDPKLTNQIDRSSLFSSILGHTGPSAPANDMFREFISNEATAAGLRAVTVEALAGRSGQDRPSDPAVVQARLQFLDSIAGSVRNEQVLNAVKNTAKRLKKLHESLLAEAQEAPPEPATAN